MGVTGIVMRRILVAMIACLGAMSAQVRAGEGPDELAPEVTLSADDTRQIASLLNRLGEAMVQADPQAVGELLSDTLSREERASIMARVRGDLERVNYPRFEFDISDGLYPESAGPDEIRALVQVRYEYESRDATDGMANYGNNAYEFRFIKIDGEWRITSSVFFDQMNDLRFHQLLGWLFFGGFVGILVVFFWIWMCFDAWMRTKRLRNAILLFLSTPVGAGLYFFAVYLRRQFVPREE